MAKQKTVFCIKRVIATAVLCLLMALVIMPNQVYADSPEIRNIAIYIELNQDGSADISEIWNVTVTSGTEWYLVQGNLGDIEIQNFSVMDENGTVFENEGYWDIDRTIDEKAGKCGIVDKGYGDYELCWGVGSYGNHAYTVSYHMTNFVKGFDDYCAFNQRVINDQLSSAPQEIHVVVTKPGVEFTTDTVGVWAFGFEGTIFVEDGVVAADSTTALDLSDYVTIMCRFPRDMFDTENIVSGSFEDMKDTAFAGSDYSSDSDSYSFSELWYDLMDNKLVLAIVVGVIAFIVYLIVLMVKNTKANACPTTFEEACEKYNTQSDIKFYAKPQFWIIFVVLFFINFVFALIVLLIMWISNKKDKEKITPIFSGNAYPTTYVSKEVSGYHEYCREIPMEGYIPVYYTVGKMTGLSTGNNDIIGAYLLKWLQSGYIEIRNERKAGIGGALGIEAPSIVLKKDASIFDQPVEGQLYKMLKVASGGDNILQEKEMYNWSKKNYEKVSKLMAAFYAHGKAKLKERAFLGTIPALGILGLSYTTQDAFTEAGREQMLAFKGLRNFLKDFTIMEERQPEDIALWDQYMIAAQMFGMAEQVAKKFEQIYPQYFTDHASYYNNFVGSYVLISAISHASANGASAGSSGSGGSSSSGGGGGSSGGGSGGGSR